MPGVYISYPFCTQKCSFCNFASGVSSVQIKADYRRVLLDEIHRHDWRWAPETAYFGGGTPSLMPREELDRLMSAIARQSLTEVTLECAPGTFEPKAAEGWKVLGINRISLGVQSFITAELRQTGRRHTAETVRDDIAVLRAAGIDNINIDLIAGLPGQTRESWNLSLDWIERLQPPHVSVYIFELDEDSRLGREALSGGSRYGVNLLPDDDLVAELYETAVHRLETLGIHRYEISNFARDGWQSRHNLKYWQLEPYIGFGLDAHSFDGSRRWSNPDTLESYLHRNDPQIAELTDASEEHFFVGLRLSSGIEPTPDEWSRFAIPISKWTAAGMLEQQGARLRLSNRGVLLSNEVLQEFIDV
jgi:oxygen-independent coproporphyrinogen III oxidase